jgi:hypothetical protein
VLEEVHVGLRPARHDARTVRGALEAAARQDGGEAGEPGG